MGNQPAGLRTVGRSDGWAVGSAGEIGFHILDRYPALVIDGAQAQGPWIVRAIGAVEVLYVGLTRTGGIVGQFQLIYDRTRFDVTREPLLRLPALSSP